MTFKEIKDKRKEQEQLIQNKYNNLDSYKQKLVYIYNILLQSQQLYLEYRNDVIFTNEYLEQLISELDENIDESEFVNFIEEKIVSKMLSDHIYIYPLVWENEDGSEIKNESIEEINEPFKNRNVEITFTNDTAIIKIKSFSNKRIDKDAYLFKNLEQYLNENDIDNIIIDIRGNGGGSDAYFKHFSIFTDEDVNFNDASYDLFMQQDLSIIWTPIPKGECKKHYNKYLLIDNKVFSTAEKLAKCCKQTGYATLIGEQTLGEGNGFTPYRLKLSDGIYKTKKAESIRKQYGAIGKQVVLNFPTDAPINEYGQIDYENCYNTKPDIECQSEEALDVALETIKESQAKKHK